MSKVIFETDSGNIEFNLFSEDAPNTVDNFTKLVDEGLKPYAGIVPINSTNFIKSIAINWL